MSNRLLDKSWLPLILIVSTAAAIYFAASPDISATTDPVLSKPMALLAKINLYVWGLMVGIVADWLVFTLPVLHADQPEPYTVQWFERQRLKLGMMAAGVVTWVFGAGAGSLAS